ncbi:MAG TPA: hypothetical protein VMB48_06820 [Steroidobacteraceae bacterium]|nr:hypothetical protein [Steroidobacteraceae bacterium]
MNTRIFTALTAAALLAAAGPSFAASHGGFGGHMGGGHFGGGHFAAPHFAPRVGVRVGGTYGLRPGYGVRAGGWGGYGGYHPFWGGAWRGGYWGGAFWPAAYYGWSYPLFLAALPALYATYWWDGMPYYYVNNVYYTYSAADDGYVVTDPPPVSADGSAAGGDAEYAAPADAAPPPAAAAVPGQGGAMPGEVFAYPRNGQSEQQQATDKYECHKWAQSQTGFDPTMPPSASNSPANRDPYRRAMIACLDARGYSTR